MLCTLQRLHCDVMARLGENTRPQPSFADLGFPSADEMIRQKSRSLLPAVGMRLIAEAPLSALEGGEAIPAIVVTRLMPCGLYSAEFALCPGIIRICSLKMGSWRQWTNRIVDPGDPGWRRQWSAEPAIAGCPDRPRAYLAPEGGVLKVRALGSASPGDALEGCYGWRVPEPDEDDSFLFPEALYPLLVTEISKEIPVTV